MPLRIDDAFIREWHPKYAEMDEGDYVQLVAEVAREMSSGGTISQRTFSRIWNWKGAMRVIGHVRLDQYDIRYAPSFRRAGLVASRQRDLARYESFRRAIDGIMARCPGWSLRQVDRALFAYHKLVLDHSSESGCWTQRNMRARPNLSAPVLFCANSFRHNQLAEKIAYNFCLRNC
jgi:hypothetical protein